MAKQRFGLVKSTHSFKIARLLVMQRNNYRTESGAHARSCPLPGDVLAMLLHDLL
jgi:hypothetical protein